MKASGRIITWKASAAINGVMVDAMKANIKKIRSMVSVFTNGLTVVFILAIGVEVNSMGLVLIRLKNLLH